MTSQVKQELDCVVATIQATVNVQEIYLFGSFAEKRERADSDFDIYVALDTSEIRPMKAIQKINMALSHMDLRSIDILANYYGSFLAAANGPTLEREILTKGVKLYERSNSHYQAMA